MNRDAKIYVAGHQGLVGSALVRQLRAAGHVNLLLRTHGELDLTNQNEVKEFLSQERPEYVFLAAAKVGGILANSTYPAEFIYQNLLIQANVIHEAYRSGVKRLLFLGSSCIYPKHAPQPMKEEYLLTGSLEPTNRAYAVAKIAGIEMCWSYNRQHGTHFLAAMPSNLYGPGDHYDLHNSHVIAALIRKMHEAKMSGADQVVIWGTGTPRREFLYCDDAAEACVFLMDMPERTLDSIVADDQRGSIFNIGCGKDLAVCELAELIAEVVGFSGSLVFDTSKPDGTPRKLLDITRLAGLGWKPSTELQEGLMKTYRDLLERQAFTADVGSVPKSVNWLTPCESNPSKD
jgi:GDP-L-fucose synthase